MTRAYFLIGLIILIIMTCMAHMRERIAKLEVKVEHLEDGCTTP